MTPKTETMWMAFLGKKQLMLPFTCRLQKKQVMHTMKHLNYDGLEYTIKKVSVTIQPKKRGKG